MVVSCTITLLILSNQYPMVGVLEYFPNIYVYITYLIHNISDTNELILSVNEFLLEGLNAKMNLCMSLN